MRRLTQGTERCGRGALRATALPTLLLALLVAPAAASASDFNPGAGTYTANTTTLKLTGPGPTDITGVDEGGVAVFHFDGVNIPSGVTINAAGSRPLKIAAGGNLTLGGTINAFGTTATQFILGPFAGGPGGGAGGAQFPNKGAGPGGGGAGSTSDNGGAGGGFGGKGARGGVDGSGTGGAAGLAYGDLNVALQGGSGGAGASTDGDATGGGGGGGGVALFGTFVTIASSGSVNADGGGGASGGSGASGGGSGGGIVVHGDTVEVNGALLARGGIGGAGGCCGDGGGGGGGRVAYQFRTLVASGTALVNGGASGVSVGCCGHGELSPDTTGANGVITKTEAAAATTSPATGISANGATLNGTVNPHSAATSFHFDFGTTTGYGAQIPAPDAGVGADDADHAVSQGVGGLSPSTTYHYRLVATDSMGFSTFGADVGFTTAPATVPPPPPPPPTLLSSTTTISSLAFVKFTKLVNLAAKNLPAHSTVTVTCKTKKKKQQKKGCAKKKTYKNANAKSKLNLRKPFAKKKLPVGTHVTITITAPGFIGKQIRYTIRKRKLPKSRVLCIKPGHKPAKC